MNLTKTAQKKIREYVIWNSPKMTKLLKQREELLDDLIQCLLDSLNPSERYIYEKFPNYLKHIDFSELLDLFQLTGKNVPEIDKSLRLPVKIYSWGNDYDDREVFKIAYRIVKQYDNKYDKMIIPHTFLNWDDLRKYHIPAISKSDEYPKFTFCDGAHTVNILEHEDTGVDRSWVPDVYLLEEMLNKDFNIETKNLHSGRHYDIKFFTNDTGEIENILELVNKLRYNYFLRTNYLVKLKDFEGNFLPKINTLEEIKSINLDWYDLAVNLLNARSWEISGKTKEEILARVEYGIEI